MDIDDIGLKIGTSEEAFLTEELIASEKAVEIQKKAIEANEWLIAIYKNRIKEIEDDSQIKSWEVKK